MAINENPLGKATSTVFKGIYDSTLGRLFNAGLNKGATPNDRLNSYAIWRNRNEQTDWRVKLTLPPLSAAKSIIFGDGGSHKVLEPLIDDLGIVFPLTPNVIMQQTATYTPMATTHSNYPFYGYQNSEPQNMTLIGEFPVQNKEDARYWVATLHFLRTVSKMFFGGGDKNLQGNPPPILRLNGYGKHVLHNIPVVVQSFSCELTDRVDYISTSQSIRTKKGINDPVDITVGGRNITVDLNEDSWDESWAPASSIFTVQLQPTYSRESVKNFDLKKFASGKLTSGDDNQVGFI